MKISMSMTREFNSILRLEGTTTEDDCILVELHEKLTKDIEKTIKDILLQSKSSTNKDGEE